MTFCSVFLRFAFCAAPTSLARFLQPHQVAVGIKGGAHLVPLAINTHLALHPDHVVVSLDIRNAFNEGERALIMEAIGANECTRFLVPLMGAMLQPVSKVFGIQGLATVSNGLQQGESTSTAVFAIAIHSALQKAADCLAGSNGMAIAFVDDAYFAGLPVKVAAAVEVFKNALDALHYELVPQKCSVMAVDVQAAGEFEALRANEKFPSITSDSFQWGGLDRGGGAPVCDSDLHKCGLVIVGVPVGGKKFIDDVLGLKANEIARQVSKLRTSLQIVSRQNAFAVLVKCLNVKFQYLLQSLPPALTSSHCEWLDRQFRDAALDIMNVRLEDMHRWALIRLRLAGSKGGCGLISHQSIAKQARVATLVRSLPHLVGYTPAGPRAKRWEGILPLSVTALRPTRSFEPANVSHGRSKQRGIMTLLKIQETLFHCVPSPAHPTGTSQRFPEQQNVKNKEPFQCTCPFNRSLVRMFMPRSH